MLYVCIFKGLDVRLCLIVVLPHPQHPPRRARALSRWVSNRDAVRTPSVRTAFSSKRLSPRLRVSDGQLHADILSYAVSKLRNNRFDNRYFRSLSQSILRLVHAVVRFNSFSANTSHSRHEIRLLTWPVKVVVPIYFVILMFISVLSLFVILLFVSWAS